MAFKPSNRRKQRASYIIDLNLAPLLSLFVALIPMLLLTAIFQKVGILNLYLPTVEEAVLHGEEPTQKEDFTLAITVTPEEISLRRDNEVIYRESRQSDPTLGGLAEALRTVKEEAPEKRDAILLLDASILYDTIIQVMDTAREKDGMEMFTDISLADRVVEVR